MGSPDKTGNTDHNVSLYLLSPWDPPFPLTPRVSKRIGRKSSLFPWVEKKSESLPTPSANTSSRWLGKSYKPWLKKISPKYKLLKDGATLLSSHVYLHPYLFSSRVWGLDQGRCHQLLSFSCWVTDLGKGWEVTWHFSSPSLPAHLGAHRVPAHQLTQLLWVTPSKGDETAPVQSSEKTDAKQAARLDSLIAKEMSTDCIPEGKATDGLMWLMSLAYLPLGIRNGENTRVFTHMLHKGKG